MCPICKTEGESLEHLFLLCSRTAPLWFGLQICHVPTNFNTTTICSWLDLLLEISIEVESGNPEYFYKALTALCSIWKARNCKKFEDKNPNPKEVLFSVNTNYMEFLTSKPVPIPNPIINPLFVEHLIDGIHHVEKC